MANSKTTFAVCLGNRGFFPAELMFDAREELQQVLQRLGHQTIMLDQDATSFGAIETREEGRIFARFLEDHRADYGGIILSLPNFGDENGAAEALKNADVPIFIHAYPDEMDKMAPALRRDAFCGKLSITDVFWQNHINFTVQKPHTVSPQSDRFADNIDFFDRVCRAYNGLKDMVVGAIGARTTAFKTVRFDELALVRHGIRVETLDLSQIFARMDEMSQDDDAYKNKRQTLLDYSSWEGVPDQAIDQLTRLGVAVDEVIEEYGMDAIAIRCWQEMQEQRGISPCVLLSELNNRGIAAACEVDVGNAVAMHALGAAADAPPICLDWNNNYKDEDDKCILFHCGPVPQDAMARTGRITDHGILANAVGEGHGFGCNVGRIKPGPFTFASSATEAGKLKFYLGRGEFTGEEIPQDFFGCGGVAEIDDLQDVLLHVARNGYRHHVSCVHGDCLEPVIEVLDNYLDCQIAVPQD